MSNSCCKRLQEILGDYLDGELDPELCSELQKHLGDCEPCRVVVDTTKRTIQFYCAQRPRDIPAGVLARLLERLRHERRGKS